MSASPIRSIAFPEQNLVVALVDPAARTGRMREGNDHRFSSSVLHGSRGPDQLRQWDIRKKSLDRKTSDRDQDRRTDDSELGLEPVGAACLLLASGNAIASTARVWSGVAARDSGDVNHLARSLLVDARAREPAKESFSRSSGKRHPALRFHLSRRLTHEHRARIGSEGSNWANCQRRACTADTIRVPDGAVRERTISG